MSSGKSGKTNPSFSRWTNPARIDTVRRTLGQSSLVFGAETRKGMLFHSLRTSLSIVLWCGTSFFLLMVGGCGSLQSAVAPGASIAPPEKGSAFEVHDAGVSNNEDSSFEFEEEQEGGSTDAGQNNEDASNPDPADDEPNPPAVYDPALDGDLVFSTSQIDAELSNGSDLPLTIYLPSSEGSHPVVVFTHGFQLSPSLYESYGEHLASWGYVVVMPQMPGGALGPIGAPNHASLKDTLKSVLSWVVANANDAAGPLTGKANANQIGLAGHSMGGKISLLTATEDSRVVAVFGIDPVDSAGGPGSSDGPDYPSVTPELMDDIMVPLGILGETTNATCDGLFCQACAPEENNFHQYYLHATSPALEIEVLGANHMSFLDDPNCGFNCSVCPAGTDDPAVSRQLVRRYMNAFFQVFLFENDTYAVYLDGMASQFDVAAGLITVQSKNGL